ncbi:outer membrane protein assembly factor BamE [Noviherbaspirillum autotrophicum]|uniref:Outer membrane protein assembly factor BamE n=1 Tax=Noviherbaspirillum autotrophicum TaxID=709839 RepID=A0A0C2BKJ4_9BURK|nr:outer membrane protein assembly factor BamE [Noviherbaspirillum autotrophicum]KIF81760.1 SmpA/OmlA domain protein [Noviherbaspirillum autotrophicum]
MNFSRIDRTPALAGALCLVAACLAGCASKNPLIDEPAIASKAPEQQAQKTEAKPADDTAAVTTGTPTGIRRFLGIFTPYRVDVQQGNFVSREMVTQLKEGMQRKEAITREQVRFALGTPLLTDIFHADRWDYVFRLKKRSGEIISSRVTVFFKDNRLVRIEGGLLPTEQEYLALIAGSAPGATQQGK